MAWIVSYADKIKICHFNDPFSALFHVGLESRNSAVHADFDRSYLCCDVCSLLGPVSFVMLIRQNNKGGPCLSLSSSSDVAVQ